MIKSFDDYGQEVKFNLGKDVGEAYNTLFGGIFTLCAYAITTAFIIYVLNQMWTHNEDDLLNIRNYLDLNDQGRVQMNSTGILNFFYVEKQTQKLNDWVNDKEWNQYIQIHVA
jgi:hypothetical protein